jgi:hypothetical protein
MNFAVRPFYFRDTRSFLIRPNAVLVLMLIIIFSLLSAQEKHHAKKIDMMI